MTCRGSRNNLKQWLIIVLVMENFPLVKPKDSGVSGVFPERFLRFSGFQSVAQIPLRSLKIILDHSKVRFTANPKTRPYMIISCMLCNLYILGVGRREREPTRPCHTMTSRRHAPLPGHSLDCMIDRMLSIPKTHIRPSTGSDAASTSVWTHLYLGR